MNKKAQLKFTILRGIMALAIALLVTTILVFLSIDTDGDRFSATLTALYTLLVRPFVTSGGAFNLKSLTDILSAMTPTIFTGLAACVMFSANQFNLGAEGGIMLGAFCASLIAIYVPLPSGIHLIVALLVGTVAVGIMMLIPAILKAKWNVSEMVCSLMLNYVIMYFLHYLMNTFLADRSKGTTQTYAFLDTARVPELISNGSKLTWGFIVALVMVALVWLFMYRTKWGYQIRMLGKNPEFARYSGIKVAGVIILCQVVGGLLAGLGGGLEVLGRYTSYSWTSLPGYGWTGITIAVIAGNNPLGVPFAAFLLAYLDKGCSLMATYCGVPSQLIDIIQPVVFLFFAAEQFLSGYRQKLVVRSAQEEIAAAAATAAIGGDAAEVVDGAPVAEAAVAPAPEPAGAPEVAPDDGAAAPKDPPDPVGVPASASDDGQKEE